MTQLQVFKPDSRAMVCHSYQGLPATIVIISIFNESNDRRLYRYGGHLELVRFKEYYGMPRGHEHIPIYSLSINARLSGHFFLTFSQNKIVMGKKCLCAVFGCNNDRLIPEKYTVKDHISDTKRV